MLPTHVLSALSLVLALISGTGPTNAQSTPQGVLNPAFATNSFLIGNFSAIPWQNTTQYINSTNPVDRGSIVGLVPWTVFYNWVVSLERFNGPAVGYVSWQDAITSVQKSTAVLAYAWNRNSAGNSNANFDCSATISMSTQSAANIPYQVGAYRTANGYVSQAQSGYRFIVEAADVPDSRGQCQFVVKYQSDIVALAKNVYNSMPASPASAPSASGRRLQSAAGCAGAIAGGVGAAIGAAAGCIASLGIACGAAVAGGVAGVGGAAAGAADACPGCFPGHANAITPQGPVRMDQLSIGDLVLTSKGYEPIFVFGEQDHHKAARMVSIQTSAKAIEMTHDHFIPTSSAADGKTVFKRAGKVAIGDKIWVQNADGTQQLQSVINIDATISLRLFNPYTASGTIVVDDVVASVHSQWFLDDVCDRLKCVAYLPKIYQVAMLPVRAICWFVGLFGGPAAVNAVDRFFMLSYMGHNYPKAFMAGLMAIPAVSAWAMMKNTMAKAA